MIFTDFNLTHVEQKMFPAKVLADLSSVHGRPTKRPNSYEQHKANLKKLLRQRQKQILERRNKQRSDIKSTTSPNEVRINNLYMFRASLNRVQPKERFKKISISFLINKESDEITSIRSNMDTSRLEEEDINLLDDKELLKNDKAKKPRPIRTRKRNQGLRRYRVSNRKTDANSRKTNVSEKSLQKHDDKVT